MPDDGALRLEHHMIRISKAAADISTSIYLINVHTRDGLLDVLCKDTLVLAERINELRLLSVEWHCAHYTLVLRKLHDKLR